MAINPLNSANFDDFIVQHRFCVVDFWAQWCGPCQIMGPVLDSLSLELTGATWFGAVDVDQQQELAESKAIMSIPTLVLYVGGIEVDRIIGMRSKSALREIFSKYLL